MVSTFRAWLRSDMRVLRWVFLILYLALLAGLVGRVFGPNPEGDWYVLGPLAGGLVVLLASKPAYVIIGGRA